MSSSAGPGPRVGAKPRVFFGGGGRPAGCLRDLLAARIEAAPPGGSIDWVTYYFRDRRLAAALLAARRRGVRVTVTIDARPRTVIANQEVVAMLSGPAGLGSGFRTLSFPSLPGCPYHAHLHEKLYCFSHPYPHALIGTFNPSGDVPEEHPEIIAEIGDQDRGYNFLVELDEPRLVRPLVAHARWLHRLAPGPGRRLDFYLNYRLRGAETEIFFWPRLLPHPVRRLLRRLGPGTEVRIAASHLKGAGVIRKIIRLARHGCRIAIIAEATERRVPATGIQRLAAAGISLRQVGADTGLPMHDKFALITHGGRRWVAFGSWNWTTRSWWFNHEIGAISTNAVLCDAFAARWRELAAVAA